MAYRHGKGGLEVLLVHPGGPFWRKKDDGASAAEGMSERSIILTEALDGSERSRQIRSRLSAGGKRFQVFLVGKDGHTAISSDKPLSAEYLFAQVDAMPMRQDEMRRSR
jgi:hypothetical protein